MENHLILSGIYHPKHQKNNVENQAIGKMKKVNRNPNQILLLFIYLTCFVVFKNVQCYMIIW